MGVYKAIQNGFESGELDPLLAARSDSDIYKSGLAKARNVMLLPQGGVTRRDGFSYIDTLKNKTGTQLTATVTTPNGGSTANLNDGDTSTITTTTTPPLTNTPYIVAHYDLGASKTIAFADVRAVTLIDYIVEYSTDNLAWFQFGTDELLLAGHTSKRFTASASVSARYWRLRRLGVINQASNVTVGDFALFEDLGTLSESRCISFHFSNSQTYKMVLTDKNIQVYKDNVLQTALRSPFTSAQLAAVKYTQSLDTMLLFHEDVPPFEVKRLSTHTDWKTEDYVITTYPTYQFTAVVANPAATLTPVTTAGVTKLTASAGVFTSAHVGQRIDGNGGTARIVSYTSSTVVYAKMLVPFYDTTAIASGSWTLETGFDPAWGATRGYPRSGTYHQGRLWIGGSRDLPMTIFASKVDSFADFNLDANLDSDAIQATLDSGQVASINQVHSGRHLQIFTSSAEFFVPASSDSAITPNNILFVTSTSFGSDDSLPVHNIDGTTVFVTRAGNSIREAVFDDLRKSYTAPSLTLLASHIINNPKDVAFRKTTTSSTSDYYFIVNGDGTVAVMNKMQGQKISGWTLLEVNGTVKSIGTELEDVFIVVERVINSVSVRYIERLALNNVLDSSKVITFGLPATTFTGLEHLNGEIVEVVADGNRLTPVLVSGGSATIERAATTKVEFGVRYKANGDDFTIETMPFEMIMQDGTLVGKKKRILEITIILNKTKGLKANTNRVSFRQLGSNLLDSEVVEFTGQKVVEGLTGYSDEVSVTISNDSPQPATINGIAYKVSI